MDRLTSRYDDGEAFCDKFSVVEDVGVEETILKGQLIDKLADYEDAEEQGLLLKLPCKVGDKIWAITTTANYSLGAYAEVPLKHPQEKKIQSITITRHGVLYHVKDRTYSDKDFGKTVFLTKEEAEQALANMKGV